MKKVFEKFRWFIMNLLDRIRGSFWFFPMAMAFWAAVLAFVLRQFRQEADSSIATYVSWLVPVETEGSRAILSVIAGSMITTTGVVFSITIVALTLASSQFGPRLLRNYLRDRTNQFAFGTFVATFLYSLIMLGGVRDGSVPLVGVAVAMILAFGSLVVLIFFIHNTSVSLQASTVIASVSHEVHARLEDACPGTTDEIQDDPQKLVKQFRSRFSDQSIEILSEREGFLRILDRSNLMKIATDNDLFVEVNRQPGEFVMKGEMLLRISGQQELDEESRKKAHACFVFGNHRTAVQDILFPIAQLSEISIRALSPGINDPRTASDCIHRLGAVVASASQRQFSSSLHRDEEGAVRIYSEPFTFPELVSRCYDPIFPYGKEHFIVVNTIYQSLGNAGKICKDPIRKKIIREQLERFSLEHLPDCYNSFSSDKLKEVYEVARRMTEAE